MKKIKVLIFALCAVVLISGCGKTNTPVSEQPPENNSVESPETQETQRIIKGSQIPEDVRDWKAVSSYQVDLDGDGYAEKVELSTSAEYDAEDGFFWNDGQYWTLSVTDGDDYYLLSKEYISSGYPYFEVSDYYTDEGDLVRIDYIVSGGAKLSLRGYVYSKADGGYAEAVEYDTDKVTQGGINKIYSSFPSYGG